jgi:DNA processing protein
MSDDHLRMAFALAVLPGVGRRRLRALLTRTAGHRVASARELADFVEHAAADLKLRAGPSDCERAWARSVELEQACHRRGWRVWVLGAPDYPERLTRLADPPALLLVHGASQPEHRPRVAVIGTREPSPWGLETAAACAVEVVRAGGIVVSGLAWGIDTAAHSAAVGERGCTWAVLPSGLDIIFPPSNASLAGWIVEAGGALISEYFPGSRPHPTFFVERDRLQAALSDVAIVIETGPTGGTLHTVRFARQLGLPIHVTWPPGVDASVTRPDDLPEPQQGCWMLLRDGAASVKPDGIAALLRLLEEKTDADSRTAKKGQRHLFS